MRYSNNVVNNCLLAWAFERGERDARDDIERVRDHYQRCYPEDLRIGSEIGAHMGMALLERPEVRLRKPLWSDDGSFVSATLSVPLRGGAIPGDEQGATGELSRRLASEPRLISELIPPVVMAVLSRSEGKLTILNDVVGVGRLYEMRCEWGSVWSNRLGALPVFAGAAPAIETASWQVFAAAGWFLGEMTPLAGCSKVPPGSRIVVSEGDGGARVDRSDDDLRGDLVSPRRSRLDLASRRLKESADTATGELSRMASQLGAAWDVPIAVSLTGGRDSRVSAAAVVAAGIDASFNTGDQVPGEVDAVRRLIASAPIEIDHTVHTPAADEGEAEDLPPLLDRVADIHLVHDGMRNPQEIRRSVEMPHGTPPPPTLSGHGGELGHGFYYGERAKLRRLERDGNEALMAQLEKNARRKHSAASAESYRLYLAECERTLEKGMQFGLAGPPLLDWFYMAQRLPYRSGLGARSARWSACVTPAFIRGAFDLVPRERLDARFHRMVIARLVPEWEGVPFFSEADPDASMPEIKRDRIWKKEPDAREVEEIIAGGNAWPEIFERDRVVAMWEEVRSGEGSSDYEHIFDRVVWREAFETHVRELGRAAGATA